MSSTHTQNPPFSCCGTRPPQQTVTRPANTPPATQTHTPPGRHNNTTHPLPRKHTNPRHTNRYTNRSPTILWAAHILYAHTEHKCVQTLTRSFVVSHMFKHTQCIQWSNVTTHTEHKQPAAPKLPVRPHHQNRGVNVCEGAFMNTFKRTFKPLFCVELLYCK